jgi:SAM-dependent methyltransferase
VAEHQHETRAAYDGVVELYVSMFANRLETHPFSRNMIGAFAELVRGTWNPRAADVGCGPGHLTVMLYDLGLDAFEGIAEVSPNGPMGRSWSLGTLRRSAPRRHGRGLASAT